MRGALEVQATSWVFGYTRTCTVRNDGAAYGEMLPFFPPYGWRVQHFAGLDISTKYRINLGLYGGEMSQVVTHRLLLYRADGTLYAQKNVVMQLLASQQERIETWLGLAIGSIPAGTYGLTVPLLDGAEHGVQGRGWAHVSMVDNVTDDPTNW